MSTSHNNKDLKIKAPIDLSGSQGAALYEKKSDRGFQEAWKSYEIYQTNKFSWQPSYATFEWECDHPLPSKPSEQFTEMGMSDYKYSGP